MASALSREQALTGSGTLFPVQVLARVPAARDVVTLTLVVPGTRQVPAVYLPGQFITLAFSTGHRVYHRSYSLCGDGRAESPWEITIKRHHAGLISRHLYDRIQPGMLLHASLPHGTFTLPQPLHPRQPIVLVAGGTGIAPIFGMLRALAHLPPEQRPRVWLHYAFHSPADGIYVRDLAALDPARHWLTQWHYITSTGYRLRPEHVLAPLGGTAGAAHWYVCGPASLKRAMHAAALEHGVPATRFHSETFASPVVRGAEGDAGTASGTRSLIRVADTGAVLTSQPGATLLETLERAGYHPDFSCRAGACGTCRLRVVAGQVSGGDGDGLTAGERASGFVLSCVAHPLGEITLASAGATHAPDDARRRPRQRALRLSLTAAAAALFVAAWGFTSHSPVTAAATSASDSSGAAPSSSGAFPSAGGDDGGSGSFGQNPFGSGSFSNQLGPTAPNTSSGVS